MRAFMITALCRRARDLFNLVVVLVIAFGCFSPPLMAQEEAAQEPTSEVPPAAGDETPVDSEAAEAAAAEEQAAAIIDLSTPRATLTTFLEAMNNVQAGQEEMWDSALSCIYLDDVPEGEREETGREIAQQLFDVLNTITLDFNTVPEESEERDLELTLGDDDEVPLKFRLNDDGVWRFSRSQLEETEEAFEEIIEEAAEQEQQVDARVNPLLATPRVTMQTFIEGMTNWDDGGRERAILTLDLSGIDETVRDEVGAETALNLKRVLDRDRFVIYQEIHNDAAGAPYLHLKDPDDVTGERKIEIVPIKLDETSEAVDWKFSADTVEQSQALWDVYRFKMLVAGVDEDQGPKVLSVQVRDWVALEYPILLESNFVLENWQWLGLILIIVLGMVISRLFAFFLLAAIRRAFRKEEFELDKKLEKGFVRPIRIALMAWVWWLALRPLGLPPATLAFLKTAAATISAVAAVWAVYRLVDIIGIYIAEKANRTDNRFDDLIAPLVVRALKIFTIVVGAVLIAETLNIDYKTALAGLSLGGLAFALAAKDTVGNIFGSLTILLDKPFQIGDWVTIGEVDGTVEAVGIRSTRVRTFYNSLITVPNSTMINAVIDNYGARRYRRIKTTLGLTYDTPPEKIDAFCEGVRELIRLHPYTRKDYFHVYLNEFSSSSLDIMLYCFHECPDWSTELRERHRLFADIIRLADKLGVEFAFPTSTLYLRKDDEPSGNIGSRQGGRDDPFALGRKEADSIVTLTLGKDAPVPPPVRFQHVHDQEGFEDDDDDGGDDGGD